MGSWGFGAPTSQLPNFPTPKEIPISKELITVQAPVERAILVGAPRKGSGARRTADEHLKELAELTDTAGANVVGELVQAIDRPHPGTYLGSGKIDVKQTMETIGKASVDNGESLEFFLDVQSGNQPAH